MKPLYFGLVAAFLAGVIVTIGLVSAFGGSNDGEPVAEADARPIATARQPSVTPAATLTTDAVPTASSGLPTPGPSIANALVPPTPSIPTPTAAQRPGICLSSSDPAYISSALPLLQRFGADYQRWKASSIAISATEMRSLVQLLGSFTEPFAAISPVPEGCIFIHDRVLKAARDLADTAPGVNYAVTEPLRSTWRTEYEARTTNLRAALDLYFAVTKINVSPRPFS